jgi:hypothetical protein
MDADPIGDAAAIMLEEIEEHLHEECYRNPILAKRIGRVRAELEQLQLHINYAAPVFRCPKALPFPGSTPGA